MRFIEHVVDVQKRLGYLGAPYFVRDLRWVGVFIQARSGFTVNFTWRDFSVEI